MPTPTSAPKPDIGNDAAPLVPDLPLTCVKDVAAVRDTDIGGQQACALKRFWRMFQDQRQQHRLRMALLGLTERELKDIGITSADIGYIAAHRDIDRLRDGTMYPWMR